MLLSPHQTGRAGFPHPAYPKTMGFTGMHRGPRRLQGLPAQGSEVGVVRNPFRLAEGPGTVLLGLAAQFPPQWRDFQRQLHARLFCPRYRRLIVGRQRGTPVRSGNFFQAGRSSSCGNKFSAGFLRSTGVTPLRRYYEPLRLPTEPKRGYVFPRFVADPSHEGSTLGRVSQVSGWSVDARRPLSPRGTRPLQMLVASRPLSGFTRFGGLAVPTGLTRPKQVHLRYGWHLRLPRLRTTNYSAARSVGYTSNEQFTCPVPFN